MSASPAVKRIVDTQPTPSSPAAVPPAVFSLPVSERNFVEPVCTALLLVGAVIVGVGALVGLDGKFGDPTLRRLFELTKDDGLPNWFLGVQHFMLALALSCLGALSLRSGESRRNWLGWWGFCLFFVALSCDAGAAIHGTIGEIIQSYADDVMASLQSNNAVFWDMVGTYNWRLIFLPFYAVVGALLYVFARPRLSSPRTHLFVAAGLSLLSISLLLEHLIVGLSYGGEARFSTITFYTPKYLMHVFQRTLDYAGCALLLWGLLRQVLAKLGTVEIRSGKAWETGFLRVFLAVFLGANLALLLVDLIGIFGGVVNDVFIRDIINIAREGSLPNWISTLEWFAVGLAAAITGVTYHLSGQPARETRLCFFFSGFFFFLSADDGGHIHERMGTAIAELSHRLTANGIPWLHDLLQATGSWAWQVVVLPFYAAVGVALMYFCWRQFRSDKEWNALLLAMGCIGVAVILDQIEGHVWNSTSTTAFGIAKGTFAHLQKAVEETLEASANVLLAYAFLLHAGTRFRSVTLSGMTPRG